MAPRFMTLLLGPRYSSLPQDSKWDAEGLNKPPCGCEAGRRNSSWSVRNLLQLVLALTCGVLLGVFAPKASSRIARMYHEHHHHHGQMEHPHAHTDHPQVQMDHHHVQMEVDLPQGEIISCGSTPAEAIARGCHFDMMASTWLPDECHDQELLDEMVQEGNWTWYTDQEHTTTVSQEVANSGDFVKLYPLYDFHIAHCVYLWRKLHQSVIKRLPIDEDLYDYEHTKHCTMLIMSWHRERITVTRTAPGFPACRKYSYYEPVDGVPPTITSDTH